MTSPAAGQATRSSPTVRNDSPEKVWQTLSPLLSAPGRRSMRLYDADTGKFSTATRLTKALPKAPAATYLYTTKARTHLLALDFDDSRGGRAAVDADVATAAEWITRCGGVIVTDRSPTGAHLLCPLAVGTTATFDEMNHLVRLLEARLPTLDKTPNTNPDSGCLSAPGTPAKRGGYRQLDGPLSAAVEAFTTRSAPTLLPRLYELLGALKSRPAPQPLPGAADHVPSPADYCTGTGDDERLAPAWVRDDPIHPDIAHYAQHGTLPTGQRQWDTHSEARMAVLTAAIARGHSRASIAALMAPGAPWNHGLGAAYSRYRHHAHTALQRDFTKALNWLCANPLKHRHPQHKTKNSQGGNQGTGPCGPLSLRTWLAGALQWADAEFKGKRYRWTVHAVLQALASNAHRAGEQINGVWVVGVGGRNLSMGTGLLSEDAVWRVLRELRDIPGAPLILTRRGIGIEPDFYALTSPAGITPTSAHTQRVRVEPVHDAWAVIGHHLRRIYELVAHHGLTTRADLYAAAAVSPSAGDEAVTALEIMGLLTRTGRGAVATGATSLDSIGAAHDTDGLREARISRYRAERDQWHTWLADRITAREEAALDVADRVAPAEHPDVHTSFWATAMATGPPEDPYADWVDDEMAIDTVMTMLGGRILSMA